MHKAVWALTASSAHARREVCKDVTIPSFVFPDKLDWQVLAFREFGESADFCWQVEFECAKGAMSALALARATRRRFGTTLWKPGAKGSSMEDSSMKRELPDFIANAEAKHKASPQEQARFTLEQKLEVSPIVARTNGIAASA
ncbi:hypothetical protein PPGU19_087820 (plasmid) [Paraburkholderia sp. PGU19]|nr:hypothetical protein PPGU19_087820 [Paraburkholderia sp. PGU19]